MHHWFKSYGHFTERGILPIGGVASGRVCACSLRTRVGGLFTVHLISTDYGINSFHKKVVTNIIYTPALDVLPPSQFTLPLPTSSFLHLYLLIIPFFIIPFRKKTRLKSLQQTYQVKKFILVLLDKICL